MRFDIQNSTHAVDLMGSIYTSRTELLRVVAQFTRFYDPFFSIGRIFLNCHPGLYSCITAHSLNQTQFETDHLEIGSSMWPCRNFRTRPSKSSESKVKKSPFVNMYFPTELNKTTAGTSHERYGVLNHRQLDCLFDGLYGLATRKQTFVTTGPAWA